MLQRLFRPRAARATGAALFQAVTRQARQPVFYAELGVPDTVEGRFELYSLHVVLLVCRLKGEGPQASEVSQAVFDAYLRSLDDALREMGVGDLSVGKKMRKLGEAFYGRAKAYDAALQALPDRSPLAAVIGRTIVADDEPGPLVDYAVRAVDALAAMPLAALLEGETTWPELAS